MPILTVREGDRVTQQLIMVIMVIKSLQRISNSLVGATYHGNKDDLCNWALCSGGRMGKHSNLSG